MKYCTRYKPCQSMRVVGHRMECRARAKSCDYIVVAPAQQATNSAMDAIALVKEFARCGEKFTLESAYMAQLIDQARGVAQRHQ